MEFSDFRIRKVNGQNIVVPVGETSKSFSGMIRLNDSAAEIFSMLCKGNTPDSVAVEMSKKYDVSADEILEDIRRMLDGLEKLQNSSVHIEDILEKEGIFLSTTVGMSMYPLLKNRRDNIVVKPVKGILKKYDVPLYKRGERYILHRIVDVKENEYIIIGDNCVAYEHVPFDKVIGVAVGFYRRNRYVDCNNRFYRLYSRVWVKCFPIRLQYKRMISLLVKAKHKLKLLLTGKKE